MPLSYQNRYETTFYFKKVVTSRGRFRYYTTKAPSNDCIDEIPPGFEVYEHPEYGKVSLRKKINTNFFNQEIQMVREAANNYAQVRDFIIDLKTNELILYTTDIDLDYIQKTFPDIVANSSKRPIELLQKTQRFDPMFIFTLENAILRVFSIQRRSLIGFRESWISLEQSSDLAYLAQKYCRHLGLDSFYRLKPA